LNIEIVEDTNSQRLSVEWEGGTQTLVRKFVAFARDTEGDDTWSAQDVLDKLAAEPLEVAVGNSDPPDSETPGRFICRNIELEPIPHATAYNVTATYTTLRRIDGQGPVFTEPTMTPSTRNVDVYRLNVTVPTDGDATGTTDMGGDRIDEAGKPFSWPIRQIEITIDILWDANDYFPAFVDFAEYTNKRNSAEFLGFPAGSLLYLGASFAPKHFGWYVASHRFLWDQLSHCEQRPKLDIDGRPITDGAGGIGNAAEVYWFQIYADKFDFADLFSQDELDYLNREPPAPPP
jgi:hypothetical protein